MKPYLFKIAGFELRIYSLMYILALFLAIAIVKRDKFARKLGLSDKEIEDLAFTSLFSGLIGGRLYYVLLNLDYYLNNPQDIVAVWKGGLAIHGGIIGGLIGIIIFSKKKDYNFFSLTDIAVSPLILGQALGRIGNFANGEIHGFPTFTPLNVIITGNFSNWWTQYLSLPLIEQAKFKDIVPWGIVFPANTPAGIEFPNYALHPAMFYEAILNVIAFLIMWFLIRKKEFKAGILTMSYLIFYAINRIVSSTFRAEDLRLFGMKAPFVVSTIMILIGLIGILLLSKNKKS